MIEEFAARTFAIRDIAHRQHWQPAPLSQHETLGKFYDAVIPATDMIVECHIAEFGPIGDFQVETSPVSNITAWIQAEKDWIQDNQEAIANGNRSISNLIDALVAIYQQTLFKLKYIS